MQDAVLSFRHKHRTDIKIVLHAISSEMQDWMSKSTAFRKIIEMKTSHSPFYSSPMELSAKLLTII